MCGDVVGLVCWENNWMQIEQCACQAAKEAAIRLQEPHHARAHTNPCRTLGLTPAGTPQPPRPVDVREEERQQAHPTSALRGMPPWSVIVDDRVDVWDSHSKPFVHQVREG